MSFLFRFVFPNPCLHIIKNFIRYVVDVYFHIAVYSTIFWSEDFKFNQFIYPNNFTLYYHFVNFLDIKMKLVISYGMLYHLVEDKRRGKLSNHLERSIDDVPHETLLWKYFLNFTNIALSEYCEL